MKIKPHKFHTAINVSIRLNQFIKEMENEDMHKWLKFFGTYKLQAWFDKKIAEARLEKYK